MMSGLKWRYQLTTWLGNILVQLYILCWRMDAPASFVGPDNCAGRERKVYTVCLQTEYLPRQKEEGISALQFDRVEANEEAFLPVIGVLFIHFAG